MEEVFGGDKGEIQAEASVAKPTRSTVVKAEIILYGRQITPRDVEHTETVHAAFDDTDHRVIYEIDRSAQHIRRIDCLDVFTGGQVRDRPP